MTCDDCVCVLPPPPRFGPFGAKLLLARSVMADLERQAAIRSGNAGLVGERAPDFFSTKGDPAYLKSTQAQVW